MKATVSTETAIALFILIESWWLKYFLLSCSDNEEEFWLIGGENRGKFVVDVVQFGSLDTDASVLI